MSKEVCYAIAVQEIAKRVLSLEDLERETGMIDKHVWGSNASRKKRASIVAEFKRRVMHDISILDKYELKD